MRAPQASARALRMDKFHTWSGPCGAAKRHVCNAQCARLASVRAQRKTSCARGNPTTIDLLSEPSPTHNTPYTYPRPHASPYSAYILLYCLLPGPGYSRAVASNMKCTQPSTRGDVCDFWSSKKPTLRLGVARRSLPKILLWARSPHQSWKYGIYFPQCDWLIQ